MKIILSMNSRRKKVLQKGSVEIGNFNIGSE